MNDEIVLPKFYSNADNRISILDKLKNAGVVSYSNIFLINPGEWGWPFNLREWPLEYYIELVGRLLKSDQKGDIHRIFNSRYNSGTLED